MGRAVRVDAHMHAFAPSQRQRREEIAAADATFAEMYGAPAARMATGPELRAAMERAALDGAVAAGFAFASAAEIAAQNEHLAEAAAAAGGRLAWLASVNPALPGWRTGAEAALAAGAAGFGELRPASQGWDPLGPAGRELCELADAVGAVLLWHASEPVGHRYPGKAGGIGPAALIEVACAYPRLRMVGAHLGAGAAFYLQMPELKEPIESLYFDTAAVSLLYHERAVARTVEIAGVDRVLFGSDYPLLSPRRQLDAIENALSGATAREAVCGGNADALFFSSRLARGTGVSRSGE